MKICGVTSAEDARWVADAGADAIGLNFVEGSPRVVDEPTATAIAKTVRGRALVVGVVANRTESQLRRLLEGVGLDRLQLHGSESPDLVRALLPEAYKAARIGTPEDVDVAASYPGEPLLLDSRVPGVLGGSGRTFDWTWAKAIAARRSVVLAGGLTPDNVAEAVRCARPFGVDTASGVEVPGQPRKKDPLRVRQLIERARAA